MILPDFLAPVETWMKEKEESATRLTELFLSENNLLSLLANLLVIAATAAIGEEMFFRGALQRIIGKWSKNPHLIIWSVAILFSAFHLQFYGFLPRMLLGAFFGYLVYWSKNIWLPIFAHFMNNALAVITLSNTELKENHYMTGDLSQQEIIPYTIVAILFLGLFVMVVKKLRQRLDREEKETKNLSFEE
jgi:membrane protease YdiL (CAAX protease family)